MTSVELVCPCKQRFAMETSNEGALGCMSPQCPYGLKNAGGFPVHNGIPVLIAFDLVDTVCERQAYLTSDVEKKADRASGYVARRTGRVFSFFRRFVHGENNQARRNSLRFLDAVVENGSDSARILNIGSGTKGAGADLLYEDRRVELVGVDIYGSASVDYICDAHFLPFPDESFDGVWIQAVLEHVQNPDAVRNEILRILKSNGLVYAETPFMQQVHEGAYDFTRFTGVGHRNLFRELEEIAAGTVSGPGVSLGWAIRYYFIALTRSRKIGSVLAIPFQIVCRLLDHLIKDNDRWDGANGVWFMGRKTPGFPTYTAKQVISTYKGRF